MHKGDTPFFLSQFPTSVLRGGFTRAGDWWLRSIEQRQPLISRDSDIATPVAIPSKNTSRERVLSRLLRFSR